MHNITCQQCGKVFAVKPFRFTRAKYCSKQCQDAAMNPLIPLTCTHCGKTFESSHRGSKFCSHGCAASSRKGERSPNWKGGKSLTNLRAFAGGGIKKWRYAVYQRDNYTCQKCGARNTTIHAHHIKHVADYPELMLDVDNGMTVCAPCHSEIHGKAIPEVKPRFPKTCSVCGKTTKGFSTKCLSCASKNRHSRSNKTGITEVVL